MKLVISNPPHPKNDKPKTRKEHENPKKTSLLHC